MDAARLIDAVIVFTLLEGACLWLYHRRTGRGVPASDFVVNMLSGLCLMGALRTAAGGAAWPWIGAWLLAAGAAHATDLWRRWRR